MFNYDVLSEEQAMQERFQLLPDGEYEAVVDASIDKPSSNGNPMMEVTLSVYDANGHHHPVKDYLVFTRGMMWKVIHFAESAGVMKEYTEKKFCSDLIINKSVRVRLAIEKGGEIPFDKLKGKAPGSRYSDKNKVEDYLSRDKAISNVVKDSAFHDDDIPF